MLSYQEAKAAVVRITGEAQRLADKYPSHFPPGYLEVWYGGMFLHGFHLAPSDRERPIQYMGETEEGALLWLLRQLAPS